MNKIAGLAYVIFATLLIFYPAAVADDVELVQMKDDVLAAGGDWAAIEALLETLSSEDRELVIATYPERLAELEAVRGAIEEVGANWEAGLNTVSILPPELRPRTGRFSIAENGGAPWETVTIGPGEGVSPLTLPASWDWRSVNGTDWTTPIKDEGFCGASWAFAPLAAYETRIKLAAYNPNLVPDLSEQYLLSCCPSGNCSYAVLDEVANWIVCQGTVDEACFPYAEDDAIPCSESCFDRDSRKYKGEGWSWVCGDWNITDVDRIKQEVYSCGPVPTFMWVYTDFFNYTTGIYNHTTGDYVEDLCVAIVGWGNEGGVDYWICKNSWGTDWGESGWFKIKMGEAAIGAGAISYQPKVRGKVLFYEGHAPWEDFELSKRYSEWGNRLAGNGYLVHSNTQDPLTLDLLSCYDVVIISNPTTTFNTTELAAIKEFVKRGRVIASGDGDLFDSDFIYMQDNVKVAVQYVDWLATGDGGGLLVMGERAISNDEINQVANLFGLEINSDEVSDPMRYEADPIWPILGPKENVQVLASASLSISKDAFALARTTPSGYVTVSVPSDGSLNISASYEMIGAALTPEEMPLSVMADEVLPPDVVPMPADGIIPPEGEPATAPAEEAGMEVSSDPVPMAGLSFTGPIVIAAVDFGRKGEDTIGVFRPSNQWWYLDYDNDAVPDFIIPYGLNGDQAIAGDWDGDGKDTIGVFRPSNQGWYLDYNNDAIPDFFIPYGLNGDQAVAGDWNGDGKDTIGVFRPSNQGWYLDYNNDAVPDQMIVYGLNGDLAVAGDWNGDGKDTIGVFRPSNRGWYLDYNNDAVPDQIIVYGLTGDVPVVGDWNGDGKDTIGVFRPSNRGWYLDYNNDAIPDLIIFYGLTGDQAIVGDWYKR